MQYALCNQSNYRGTVKTRCTATIFCVVVLGGLKTLNFDLNVPLQLPGSPGTVYTSNMTFSVISHVA